MSGATGTDRGESRRSEREGLRGRRRGVSESALPRPPPLVRRGVPCRCSNLDAICAVSLGKCRAQLPRVSGGARRAWHRELCAVRAPAPRSSFISQRKVKMKRVKWGSGLRSDGLERARSLPKTKRAFSDT
ncbi:hypothetical protein EVAR_44102_1 [Eumeta japonica]|uniref:Uncharacterized protein n=1 Tax=Eumeta variegata TaxID=151549 RepID=A0A4C1X4N7_EUMVA|nr:hypothetical protein EVAR_44102_1 [Eumeta japonica]